MSSHGLVRSRDKLKTYLHYQNDYGQKIGTMATYLDLLLPIVSNDHGITWFFEIQTEIIYLLSQC